MLVVVVTTKLPSIILLYMLYCAACCVNVPLSVLVARHPVPMLTDGNGLFTRPARYAARGS